MIALGQLGQRVEAPPVSVVTRAPSVRELFLGEVMDLRRLSAREFEEGPRARLSRDMHGDLFADSQTTSTTFPWLGALPARQTRLAVSTALAMLDRAARETNGFRDTVERSPGSDFLRRRIADRARSNFGRLREVPRPWFLLTGVMFDIARTIVPSRFLLYDDMLGTDRQERIVNRGRTQFYQEWWRLVMRRLAFSDVVRAQLTFKRPARGLTLRPRILGQLGQTVRVTDGAPSVRELSQPAIATAERLSTAEFEAGPVAWSDPRFADLVLATLLQTDSQWPWTARPWVAALPLRQALIAAETALAMLPRRGGPRLTPARRRATGQSVARDRFNLARRLAQDIAAILRLVERVAKARLRVRAGSKEGISLMQRSFGMSGTLRFRQGEFYDAIAEVIGQVAAVIVPFAVADVEGREIATNRRTDFYQRWWRLVMQRLAFTDVRTATLSVRRTRRGVIVRPAILGRLGQFVKVREGAPPVPSLDRRSIDELSPAEFERGPDVVSTFRGAFPSPNFASLTPWVGALPRAQALLAGDTALALIRGIRGRDAQEARFQIDAARDGNFDIPLSPLGFKSGWDFVSVGVLLAARAARPGAVDNLRMASTPARQAPFLEELTEWVRGWWRLVMRRLAIADVTRAALTLRRTPRGVVVRPAILGQLAGALDADVELLGRCFPTRVMLT